MASLEITADPCECGNVPPLDPMNTHGTPEHAISVRTTCPVACDGYACTYGCGMCFCPCHD